MMLDFDFEALGNDIGLDCNDNDCAAEKVQVPNATAEQDASPTAHSSNAASQGLPLPPTPLPRPLPSGPTMSKALRWASGLLPF